MRMETPTATCACEADGLASAAKASTNRANNLVVRTISRTLNSISDAGASVRMLNPGRKCKTDWTRSV